MTLSDFLSPRADDWFVNAIDRIFFTDNVVSLSINIFNTIFFYLFIILAIVMFFSAAINAAASGRAFPGSSGYWLGVRFLLSVIWMLPTGQGNLNLAQVLATKCMKWGSTGATYAWNAALEHMQDMKPLVPPAAPKSAELAHRLFEMAVCVHTWNHPHSGGPRVTFREIPMKDRIILSADGDPEEGGIPAQCGTIALAKSDGPDEGKILDKHKTITLELYRQMSGLAKSLVAHAFPLVPEASLPAPDIEGPVRKHLEGIAAMASRNTNSSAFRQEAGKGGWAFAGAWSWQISSINERVYSALESLPVVQPPEYGWCQSTIYRRHLQVFEAAEKWWQTHENSFRIKNPAAFEAFRDGSMLSLFDFKRIQTILDTVLVSDTTLNPMGKMTNLGHAIINTAWAALAAKAMVDGSLKAAEKAADKQVFSWIADRLTGLPSALTGLAGASARAYGPVFYMGFLSLMAGGITLAWILPLTPFRLWIAGITRYLMSALMAVLAGPVWAIAHMEAEGSGFGQRSRQGYHVLLDLLLRPIIMVIGLIIGFVVVTIISELFAYVFHIAAKTTLHGSTGGLTGMIVCLVTGAGLFLAVVSIAFSVIGNGMEYVLSFIGARTPQGSGSPEADAAIATRATEGMGQKMEGIIGKAATQIHTPTSINQITKGE